MALNFRLFNCDRTFSLDKVEALIQRVAEKLSRETKIEKTYFPLPRMKDLCEELEKEDNHFEYAVFVVHAYESRLWINGEGYSKLYHTLQRVTGDRVLIVIGGDDNYKDQEERDMSVLSRWALDKMRFQFTEDYVNGVKGFIFSWEENHHPIHEEALEFYLRPKKFVPRSKQLPGKVPEKDETKNIEQIKLLELKQQELQPVEKEKSLEKEPPKHDLLVSEVKKQELHPVEKEKSLEKEPPKHDLLVSEVKKQELHPVEKEKSLEKEPPKHDPLVSEVKKQELHPVEKEKCLEKEPPKHDPLVSEVKKQELHPVEKEKSLEKEPPKHDPLVSEVKKQELHPVEKEKSLEKEFPPERKENKKMESQAGQYQTKQASAISGTPDVHILSFYASQLSVDQVVYVFEDIYKHLSIASKPKSSANLQINIQDHIMKYKPEYLVLVSDFYNIEDILNLDNQVQHYKEIVKKSSSVGTKLTFIITEDKKYREGDMISDAVHSIFTKMNQDIPSSEQPMVMSWTKTPWPAHKDALVQLLSPYGKVRAAPQQYGATKQDPTSGVPCTQSEDVPMKRGFYRASISYGRVVQVLMSEPPGWEPDTRSLNDLLMEHGSVKKAIIEFWDEGDGKLLHDILPREAKLYKIAEGLATDKMYSILVHSYHVEEEETNEIITNFINHLDIPVHVLSQCQPVEPASLMADIMCNKPDYVMFSADADVLENPDEVNKCVREHGTKIKDIIGNCVGQGVIIMLFGDKYYREGELASKEATQYVRKLTQDIVEPDRLTVMTCQNRPYITHQDWMEKTLKSKGKKQLASQGAVPSVPSQQHYFKAVIRSGQIIEVLERIPPDWKPDEGLVRKKLEENRKEKKAYLEILGNEQGEIVLIAVEKESKAAYYAKKFAVNSLSSWISSDDAKDKDKEKDTSKEKSKK